MADDDLTELVDAVINVSGHVPDAHKRADLTDAILVALDDRLARIADLEHTITQYLDSHGTAGTGVLGKRLKAAVGRVE